METPSQLFWRGEAVAFHTPATAGELNQALTLSRTSPVAVKLSGEHLAWIEALVRSDVVALFSADAGDLEMEAARASLSEGRIYISPQLAVPILEAWRRAMHRENVTSILTEREGEIIQLLSQGHSNRHIAHLLFLSPHTIRNHLSRIFAKLEVGTREEAREVWKRAHHKPLEHAMPQSD